MVEADGACVLIDCGISYRQLTVRMRHLGLEPDRIEAVLLTHEHDDHVKGLEVFLGRHAVPVLATVGTLEGMTLQPPSTRPLASGREVTLGGLRVVPDQTCHDAREPDGFV